MNEASATSIRNTHLNTVSPRTLLLLECLFPEAESAERWLDRPNAVLGEPPCQLIQKGREKEVQAYLLSWLLPSGVPPRPECPLTHARDSAAS